MRHGGTAQGERWGDLHAQRLRVARLLRRAGYHARRWGREEAEMRRYGRAAVQLHRYTAGPAVGQVAVDPWRTARSLMGCASQWWLDLRCRAAGELLALERPRMCGLVHACPACAARRSQSYASAIRTELRARRAAGGRVGPVALVTLTQRARYGESLQDALTRLRAAYTSLRRFRSGAYWREVVESYFSGYEVTRGERGGWWHMHVHVIVELRVGQRPEDVRPEIARRWRELTEGQVAGYGWTPAAGGVRPGDASMRGGWWRDLPAGSTRAIFQACKYPSPLAELDPAQLAEWVAVSHGTRWHDGGGRWRGILSTAEALEELHPELLETPTDPDAPEDAPPPPPDLGERVCDPAGSYVPPAEIEADSLARALGTVAWSLPWPVHGPPPPAALELVAQVEALGGTIQPAPSTADGWIAVLPLAWTVRSRTAITAECAAAAEAAAAARARAADERS